MSSFAGAAGHEIVWREFSPPAGARALVFIAHGFGEHSGRYEHVAERLVGEGYAVYALDHHGHGRSGGPRGLISLDNAVRDLDQLVSLAEAQAPELPRFLLGHSMGGAIALRYALSYEPDDSGAARFGEAGSRAGGKSERLSGLILSGPLVQVDGRAAAKAVGRLLGALAPKLPVTRVDPSLVSRDPAVVQAYESDPLVHHGPIPAGTVASFLARAATLPGEVSRITVPTLLMWGTADRLCAPAGSELVAQRIGAADFTAVPFEGLYHEILNEPERERVLDEICGWVGARVPALRP